MSTTSHPIHPIAVPEQPQGWAEPIRDWYFTFGAGHRAHALLYGSQRNPEELGTGIDLSRRYVTIHGTYEEARARMTEVFGQVWAAVYPDAEKAGVDEYGLTELVIA